MRGISAVRIFVFHLLLGFTAWAQADSRDVQIRLLTPLASYSQAGTPFEARVLGPISHGVPTPLPPGTLVRGEVSEGHAVRFGLRRERAELRLQFKTCESPDGAAIPCKVKLMEVDNARETVKPDNRIKGILAASHPHGWLNGMWFRPAATLAPRSFSGLIGTAGMLHNRFAPNAVGAGVLLASRLVFLRLPDPEIELPVGTDLLVRVTISDRPWFRAALKAVPEGPRTERLRNAPVAVTRQSGTPVQDIVNLGVEEATESELETAFAMAGWFPAAPSSAREFVRTYGAYASMRTHATAPVSPLLYEGRPPDLVFQKSLNSVSKRHHIRLWKHEDGASVFWLGAATHDTSIGFDLSRVRFTHRIDPWIDRERSKVVNDLSDSGCVSSLGVLSRPERESEMESEVITDGALYMIKLKPCVTDIRSAPQLQPVKRNVITRSVRRMVLETRYYLTRGSVFYWAFRAANWKMSRRCCPDSEDLPKRARAGELE